MRIRRLLPIIGLAALSPPLRAQAPEAVSPADSALTACLGATAAGRPDSEALAARAEELWRAELALRPEASAPRAGLVRVLIQCRLPLVPSPDEQLALFQQGVDELTLVLRREPRFWPARLTLGFMYARAPAFLGHTGDAITQLELATSDGGIPAGRAELADALEELAGVYQRAGRSGDAAAARARGRRLFPHDRRFGAAPADTLAVPMEEVSVVAAAPAIAASRRGGRLSSLEIVTLPGGTGDLMQSLQSLPGVTGGSESSDLSLRGGDPAESPVFLNGARLVYAGKFEALNGGLFGVLDPNVLRSARVHPGGFSARFGDALSGIIEAEAIGRPAARSRRLALNTAGPSATWMRPLNGHTGVWGSVRATGTDWLLRMHGRRQDYLTAPVSVEAIAGGARVHPAGDFQVVGLVEYDAAEPVLDVAGHRGPYRNTGGTAAAVATGRVPLAGGWGTARFSAAASLRGSDVRFGVLNLSRDLARLAFRGQVDRPVGTIGLLRAGIEVAHITERLAGLVPTAGAVAPGSPVRQVDGSRQAQHLGAFAELPVFPADGLTITPGIRLDRLPGDDAWTADPRIEAEWQFGRVTLSAAGGIFQQGAFRPTREQPGQDDRLGVARRAGHVVLGFERQGPVVVRADVYLKTYSRWAGGEPGFQPDGGRVVGSDVLILAPGERRNLQLTWSLMRGRLELPGGATIPTSQDVTHSLVAVARHRIGASWEIGTTARLSTGRPFTEMLAGNGETVLGPPNGDRYPAYQRVDLRLSRYSRLGRSLLVTFVEGLNLAGRRNVASYGTGRSPITTFFGHRTLVVGMELR